MSGFILGEKSDQKQVFTEDGTRWPVTLVKTNPCFVVGIKTNDKDGYFSIKLGFKQTKNIKNPVKGELKKAGIKTPLHFLKEIRLEYANDVIVIEDDKKQGVQIGDKKIYIGDQLNPMDIFKKGDKVDVSGQSKGKGFQGVVKRHGFKGGPKTHGQSDRWRAPGSIGQSTTPGRVYKGKRMAGRMGMDRVTVRNLEIYDISEDGLYVKGLVPGGKKSLLEIRSAK
ncbi:50S ribosomal protein L3 [Candidatus Roizmanbacteria bacterium RIFCSPHIGHO2_12_FULL_33_9]|uniref:Large ribosomal subunit protein uL3 n=1 Tax=Candidatus Roizmanbacteria bacterium RIFCSPHIGHO2_12_FULL_33_9 TaxID=1802045 RepID=A0A1F7HK58_9BACT|nr:MAG: 50S ribosomal protein L3 [Candidatus Roizmanbacteria bacterium RIFCSPHIGHO2_12_FULL_33_9]